MIIMPAIAKHKGTTVSASYAPYPTEPSQALARTSRALIGVLIGGIVSGVVVITPLVSGLPPRHDDINHSGVEWPPQATQEQVETSTPAAGSGESLLVPLVAGHGR
jgi:hypothetical protein